MQQENTVESVVIDGQVCSVEAYMAEEGKPGTIKRLRNLRTSGIKVLTPDNYAKGDGAIQEAFKFKAYLFCTLGYDLKETFSTVDKLFKVSDDKLSPCFKGSIADQQKAIHIALDVFKRNRTESEPERKLSSLDNALGNAIKLVNEGKLTHDDIAHLLENHGLSKVLIDA